MILSRSKNLTLSEGGTNLFERFEQALRDGGIRCLGYNGWSRLGFLARRPAEPAAVAAAETGLKLQLPPEYRAFMTRWNGADLFVEEGQARIRLLRVEELVPASSVLLGANAPQAVAQGLVPFADAADGGCLILDCTTGAVRDGSADTPPETWRTIAPNFERWLHDIIENAQAYQSWHRRPRTAAEVVYGFTVTAFIGENVSLAARRRFLLDLYTVLRPSAAAVGIDDDEPARLNEIGPQVVSIVNLGAGRWLRCLASDEVFALIAGEPAHGQAVRYRDVALYGTPGMGALLYQHKWGQQAYIYLRAPELAALARLGWEPRETRAAAGD